MSRAIASRPEKGAPSDQRSRRVRITDVLRYSEFTTVRSGAHAEIAIAGTRTPDRSNVNPFSPEGAAGSAGGAGGGGTWSKQPPCSSKLTINNVLKAFDPLADEDDRTAL